MLKAKNREARCPSCGALNRVAAYSFRRIPECGKCHAKLPESSGIKLLRDLYTVPRIVWFGIPIAIALFAVMQRENEKPRSVRQGSTAPTTACRAVVQPANGLWQNFSFTKRPAELTIATAVGANYFIRLVDAASGKPVMVFFASGGSTIDAAVPLGIFKIKYAAGKTWCNEHDLFGEQTAFSEAEDTFSFTQSVKPTLDGYTTQTSHWTVELILQRDGNLRTRPISRAEFFGPR